MKPVKVYMSPDPGKFQGYASSGIAQVILNWRLHLPKYGIEFVDSKDEADLTIGHIAADVESDIHVSHGMLWTEEFNLGPHAYEVNRDLTKAAINAKAIITPSNWVADVYRRDLRRQVYVAGHGINLDEWEHDYEHEGYVLYTKNRASDGLMPRAVNALAREYPDIKFLTTYKTDDSPNNVEDLGGPLPHNAMKSKIKRAAVVFMPDRETWGIAAAEAMAAGVPVLSTDAGAVKEFMKHGEAGYCFEHMNLADAVQGLFYCLQYRKTLSANAKHLASYLSWDSAALKISNIIAEVYERDIVDSRIYGGVDVVITSHNYGHVVRRAIDSVLSQRAPIKTVRVIDDSSSDNTREVVESYNDERVKYKRVDVQNVAAARNVGIYDSSAEYIVVLDADDWLKRDFVLDCLVPLRADKAVGFAYSSTEVHLDDGRVFYPPQLKDVVDGPVHKDWPTMTFDKQFTPGFANQIPSCTILRREALLRVGGYRRRYAPTGAGTEDAEMYLRLLAYGWRGAMVAPTVDNLWVHTDGSGHVSGNRDFQEVDWRAWHPWTRDYRFPFAAAATPKQLSHPIRSYEPEVSVIIPVGEKHEDSLAIALDSVEAQHNRNWEVIVVWDYIPSPDVLYYYEKAYPFARFFLHAHEVDTHQGAGHSRNLGVEMAQAKYITFLDADDYYGPHFLSMVNSEASKEHNAVIYSQYYSRMHRDQHPQLGGNIVKDEGDYVVVNNNFRLYDKERALARPNGTGPYVWTGVNVLLPKAWHDSIGGFDESMPTWEDCDYMLRLAWQGYDFHMVEHPLWTYNFASGTRRQDSMGLQEGLMEYMKRKYDRYAV